MNRMIRVSALAVALSSGWILPSSASAATDPEVLRELAAMRAQMDQMSQRIGTLEGELATARGEVAQARAAVAAIPAPAKPVAPAPGIAAPAGSTLAWEGAPRISTPVDAKNPAAGTWSFKPRGRLHFDAGTISSPGAFVSSNLGFNSRLRRLRLGFEGTVPGGFGYKAEVDLASGGVAFGDVLVSYTPGNAPVQLRVGNFESLNSLEQISSSNFGTFIERAAFNDAFVNARRIGAALSYRSKNNEWRAEAGLFAGHSIDSSFDNNGWIGAARLVYAPEFAGGRLHLGVNYQHRDFASNVAGATSTGVGTPSTNQLARYRARPNSQLTDVRFIDTGSFAAKSDNILGFEIGAIFKKLYFAGEAQWLNAKGYSAGNLAVGQDQFSGGNIAVVPAANPGFFGAYGEVGYFITGETRGYKLGDGTWARTKVLNPVGKGGMGAFQVAARLDYIDLNSDKLTGGLTNNFTTGVSSLAAINSRLARGGSQTTYLLGLNWYPIDYVRFMINYGHTSVQGGPIAGLVNPTSTAPINQQKYGVDVLQTRLQFDF